MTVSVMSSGQIGSDGTGNISGTHSPGGQPHAVIVFVLQNGSSTTETSAITYGGTAMTSGGSGTDAAGEPGRCEAWYLDTSNSIPTGDQTVSLTVSGSTSKRVYCVSLSSDQGGLLNYTSAGDSSDQANPSDSQSISTAFYVSGVACLFSGNTDANTSVANGAELQHANFSGNAQSASLIWANSTVNNGTITMGWTVGSDDVAARYVYFNELKVISGNVKLAGANQSGAKVFNFYSTTAGNNPSNYAAVLTTDASGNWTSYTHHGVIPYVFCTYDAGGGVIYTAPLQWNMTT